jgi:hypothetical protein
VRIGCVGVRRDGGTNHGGTEGDLAVRASELNVYAGEIDVLSVRSNVRKRQRSVRW